MIRLSSILLCLVWNISIYAQNEIIPLAPMPEAVSNNAVTMATVNGVPHVFSFSGIDASKSYTGIHKKAFRYNTQTDSWDTIPPLPSGAGRIAAGASTIKNKIYIIGGYEVFANGSEVSFDKVHIYDPETNTYLPDGTPIPVPIDDQVQCVYKDSLIYVVTGWSNDNNVNNVQIYNPSTDEWTMGTETPNLTIYKVFGASGSIIGDTLYYAGGARRSAVSFNLAPFIRKGYINPNDPTDITWTDFQDPLVLGYRMGAAVLNEERALWIGGASIPYNFDGLAYSNGQGVSPDNRILEYNPINSRLEENDVNLPVMDISGVAQLSNSEFIIAGGMTDNQEVTNQTWLINTAFVATQTPALPLVNIYPNPSAEFITIDKKGNFEIEIFSMKGQSIFTKKVKGQEAISLARLSSGIYYLQLSQDGKLVGSQKITKVKSK